MAYGAILNQILNSSDLSFLSEGVQGKIEKLVDIKIFALSEKDVKCQLKSEVNGCKVIFISNDNPNLNYPITNGNYFPPILTVSLYNTTTINYYSLLLQQSSSLELKSSAQKCAVSFDQDSKIVSFTWPHIYRTVIILGFA